ncbi:MULTISPECIES: shikimate dehydrogenase [Kitasatospora]|uniref:Putative shikimate 5-dehydrogenase n=1 Tax=Kitasatospora setae (strain ATCC 33774 / DSM 43861 / JCM 3304 / KCC A-0304 / NBRC 14216 / KM-6054) TaxID=452652 RepID=E4N7R3_KITSK|nr:shikimate dehydrogenase [Kitasatospora setae]BAJ27244.1 putative shikimate 5-dehydrogenase [Kitasatospora setae KM-6054]
MTTPHRAAVLGSPIAHSLSPALHTAGYAALGLTGWRYGRHEVDEAALAGFVGGLDPAEWAGLSLTMPLKRAIRPLLDTVSDTARAVDAVNTVVLDRDGRRHGDNTDVPGLVNALRERGVHRVESAAVLGAGATASSALAALAEICDGEVTAYVRGPERAAEMRALGERLGVPVRTADWAAGADALAGPLTVSTTPVGATDGFAPGLTAAPGVLFDVLYHPWPTALAAACLERGGTVLGGLDLLVHQAVLQFERFTGVPRGPLAAMRAAGEAALAG